MDEVDFTILAATSVFSELVDKCPPAEACRDAFDRTARATIKMSNSTGGFGQSMKSKRSSSRGSHDRRLDWSSTSDSTSSSGATHRHQPRRSLERVPRGVFDPSTSDAFSTSASSTSQLPALQKPHFRVPALAHVKNEADGFSLMRNVPTQPRSTGSSSEGPMTPDAAVIDPSLVPSPTAQQRSAAMSVSGLSQLSPVSAPNVANSFFGPQQQTQQDASQQQQAGVFSPGGGFNFADLPDMNLGEFNGGDTQMDLGFGLGWEGLHHDFSDGQQVDLFDGFFFGGQQGGAGGAGGTGM
jgi:hypothetical protein